LPKKNIHPEYKEVSVTCACGESFVTRSTTSKEEMKIDVCSKCHPFYTGKEKIFDTGGRIERFKDKYKGFKRK